MTLFRITSLLLLIGWGFVSAQDAINAGALYELPYAQVQRSDETLTLRYNAQSARYVSGIGWLEPSLKAAPRVVDNEVFVDASVLTYFGVDVPKLAGVRWSERSADSEASLSPTFRRGEVQNIRLVLDFSELEDTSSLERLERNGEVGEGDALELVLPRALLPLGLPEEVYGLALDLNTTSIMTKLNLGGEGDAPFHYRVFSLSNPTRLVIDLEIERLEEVPTFQAEAPEIQSEPPARTNPSPVNPFSSLNPSEQSEAELDRQDNLQNQGVDDAWTAQPLEAPLVLHSGVTQKRMSYSTLLGQSRVDIIEIAPGYGEFRVVGESFVPRTLSELSDGGLAAINASYFDTSNTNTIGLLEIDNTLLSLPTRNRAGIGFGLGAPVIDRIQATVKLNINGQMRRFSGDQAAIQIYTAQGQQVGSPKQGAIVVQRGRVLMNKVGPRRVPNGGMVIAYGPDLRELALVDTGDRVSVTADLLPSAFNFVNYAVEAGPLLVADGRAAYEPGLEAFSPKPLSNVNRPASRAAIGLKPDGTVMFVTATNMTARDLVPLFLSLGAERALQMDSGGSSTLFAAGEVINRPPNSQRKIATAVVYVPYDLSEVRQP